MTHFVRKLVMACLPLILLATWAMPAQAASAPKAKAHQVPAPLCVINSNPSQVESGLGPVFESSIADVIQVECQPIFSQNTVTIDVTQLFHHCLSRLFFLLPAVGAVTALLVPQFVLTLDDDGNATAVIFGGPSCAAGASRIFASLNAPPFPTVSTTFTILPPQNTPTGVTANPRREVEDDIFSSVATVVQVEFPSTQAERFVTLKSDELFARCAASLVWFGPLGVPIAIGPEAVVQLDNNGNAFAVAVGLLSCASGTSTITADLTTVPYTTLSTNFTVLSPRPTV
ncbi:MAG TPA: hypothetical protein VFB60_06415 [Ktedonobacteraceae bacterium]|nr:hypothetical protein [Ktedonobacteraceae bacterium]